MSTFDREMQDPAFKAQFDIEYLKAVVLDYAKWYEKASLPEDQQNEDWMIEQNVESYFSKTDKELSKIDMKTASWVIIEIATGKVIMETFDSKVVSLINTDRFKAVPILEYLQSLNSSLK